MKKLLLLTVFSIFLFQGYSQSNLSLQINHLLGSEEFAMNQQATNNLQHQFMTTRLEYYLSEISIIHDGGQEDKISDLWILVNADAATKVALGTMDITNLEAIKLHIGVDSGHNHLDPNLFDVTHPLGPKSPSMHWGWTVGYRFIAFEGQGGHNLDQDIQLHGLGDENYAPILIEYAVTAVPQGDYTIHLDADYTRVLENIEVNAGVYVHGQKFQAKQAIENMRDYVFSRASLTGASIDISEIEGFAIRPNLIENGTAILNLELSELGHTYDLIITDIRGKQLQQVHSVDHGQQIDLSSLSTGMYFVNLIKEGQAVLSEKIMIK